MLRQSPHWQAAHALESPEQACCGMCKFPLFTQLQAGAGDLGKPCYRYGMHPNTASPGSRRRSSYNNMPAGHSCTHPHYMTATLHPPHACSMRPAAVHGARKGWD